MEKSFVAALILIAPVMAAGQDTYEKNNLPCVAELCIGDGLNELAKVDWDRAKNPLAFGKPRYVGASPPSHYQLKEVNDLYRGNVKPAAPYLADTAFDAKALPLLKGVTAACGRKELWGTFKTKNGNPTRVKIALVPDKTDVSIQRWTVVAISRDFPEAKSLTQQADVRKQLDERYDRFNFNKGRQKGIDGVYTIHQDAFTTGRYGFDLSLSPDVNDHERYRLHPACGGGKKISID